MNWDAIGAIAEGIGALAVVITLAYLAIQVKYAKSASADTNRLMRATGVRDMTLALAQNDELRRSLIRTFNLDPYAYAQAPQTGHGEGEIIAPNRVPVPLTAGVPGRQGPFRI